MPVVQLRPLSKLKLDLAVITLLSFAAFSVSQLLGNTAYFKGTAGLILFTVPAIAYLCVVKRKPIRKLLAGSLVFGLGLGFFYEFVMQASGGYNVVSVYLPRLFGLVPFDSVIAHFLMAGLVLTFYEHFIVKADAIDGHSDVISKRLPYAIELAVVMTVVAIGTYAVKPELLAIPYPYAILGTLAVLPVVIRIYRYPDFGRRLAVIPPYFVLTFILFMIVAIRFGWWLYPESTSYLGWVTLGVAGNISFPLEELLFWMVLYAPAIVTYYATFIETDGKVNSSKKGKNIISIHGPTNGKA